MYKSFKSLDLVTHYGGGEYIFLGAVHPKSEMPPLDRVHYRQSALHTEKEVQVTVTSFSNGTSPVYYSDTEDEYLVLYQRVNSNEKFVRPIQMFFEHVHEPEVGEVEHRFSKKEKWSGQ